MFSFGLKGKFILFSVLFVPFLIIELLSTYVLWIPENSWFFNVDFLRVWFYIIFLSFVFIPFSEIILFKKGTFFQRFLLILIIIFLGVDLICYSWARIVLDEVFITFILIIFLNFSSNFLKPKIRFKKIYQVFHMVLLVLTSGLLFNLVLISFNHIFGLDYIMISMVYILIIFLIISYLFNSRNQFLENDT